MRAYYLIVLLSFSVLSYCAEIRITIHGLNTGSAALYSLEGEKTFFIDSLSVGIDGIISFTMDESKRPSGIYRISIENKYSVDFLFAGEDVALETYSSAVSDSLRVISSETNRIYYQFREMTRSYKSKMDILMFVYARFPKNDTYYQTTLQRIAKLQSDYLQYIGEVAVRQPNTFIARYVETARLPVIPISVAPEEQLLWLKTHSLDNLNFKFTELIHSDAFTSRAIEYLTYYRNPQLTKEALEQEFMKGVDTILNKARVNPIVYQHLAQYLIDGFKRYGFDLVIDYILDNYVIKDDVCLDEKTEAAIKKRIDQARILKIGAPAPAFSLPDSAGRQYAFPISDSGMSLIIFYASWCPHCKAMIPQLYENLKKPHSKKIRVITISLDTKREEWIGFVQKNCPDWINLCDFNGWDSKAANDYYIYATPSMFLVDNSNKILAKPTTLEQIKQLIKY
jgi:thiol-disulfide isomerase/thioredoxin